MHECLLKSHVIMAIMITSLLIFTAQSEREDIIGITASTLLNIELTNDTTSPSFIIQVNGTSVFESSYFQYNSYNTSNNRLKALSISSINSGIDFLGSYRFVNINWSTNWITTIKVYDNKDAIVFRQTFISPPDTDLNATYNGKVTMNNSYIFPTLCQTNISKQFGVTRYKPHNFGIQPYSSLFDFNNLSAIPTGGHLVLSPKIYPFPYTLIYGSLNDFFIQYIGPSNQIMANNKCFSSFIPFSYNNDIPGGYMVESILFAVSTESVSRGYQENRILMPSSGVNAGLYEYGDMLLSKYAVKTRPNILDDIGPSNVWKDYVGYATTAFYFYNPCDCYTFDNDTAHLQCSGNNTAFEGCKTYQDTLIAYYNDMMNTLNTSHSYSTMKHVQIDSWWYGEAYFNGVNFWEDDEYYLSEIVKSFPDGLAAFWKHLNYPLMYAHCGAFIANNTYQYNDIGQWIEPAMPQGTALWNYLFNNGASWGLRLLNHDHLHNTIDETPLAMTNISIISNWLSGMNEAAELNDIDIHYIASHSATWITSTMYKAVKYTRGSADYVSTNYEQWQWAMAPESSFTYGLGLITDKDTFYSNTTMTEKCDDCRLTNYVEVAPWIHAISALLSGGTLTVSDKIGSTNYSLINMTVRNDGKLLKPSTVYMPVELEWFGMIFNQWPYSDYSSAKNNPNMQGSLPNRLLGELYTTYSIVDQYIWYYIWSVQISDENIFVSNQDLNINYNDTKQIVIYQWDMNDNKYGVNINDKNSLFQFVEINNTQKTWNVNVTTRGPNNNLYGSYTMITISQSLSHNGWILLGEVGKVLSVSPVRIKSISVENKENNESNVQILANGIKNENIKLSFIKWKTSNLQSIQCIVSNTGFVSILINNDQFTCSH